MRDQIVLRFRHARELHNTMNKTGQIWIETVLYTVITLVLIGIVLSLVNPRINEAKDRLAVDQSIQSLSAIDEKINVVSDNGQGNVRIVEFTMKRGSLIINSTSNAIQFIVSDLSKPYSEAGVEVPHGRIKILSEVEGKSSRTILTIEYPLNITFDGVDSDKTLNAAPTPYRLAIHNLGISNEKTVVDITEGSGK